VEAAFHFRSRRAFFDECYRVLCPGGALSISDIAVRRWPVSPGEVLAGLTQLRVFGLQRTMAMTPGQIAAAVRAAGLTDVQVTACGDRVIAPALRLTAQRLAAATAAPAGQRAAARLLLRQVDLLWRRGIIDYLVLRRPAVTSGLRPDHQRAQPASRRPTAAFSIAGSSSSTALAAGPSGTKLSLLVTRAIRPV
jgi:hypothetical protein